ncbi:DUF6479 family protein [Streptomyces sp. NPDC091412]|uniref:DUF6479 family protein n=1 Tax=Streptomyces sp. NPDC091412 TaxID=3366002 RepID=UPI003825EDB6
MFRTYRSSAARLPPCPAAGSAPRPRRLGTHRPGRAGWAPARDTTWYEAAGAGSAAGIAVIVVGGLVIAAVLVWTVRLGSRVKQGEPRTPRGGDIRRCRSPDRSTRSAGGVSRPRSPAPRRPAAGRPRTNSARPAAGAARTRPARAGTGLRRLVRQWGLRRRVTRARVPVRGLPGPVPGTRVVWSTAFRREPLRST